MIASNTFEPALALADTVRLLERFGFAYFLVGSFASGFRGEFRATNDLDIVCRFEPETSEIFLNEAKSAFYCDEVAGIGAIRQSHSFNIIHEKSFVKVDFFTRISEFEAEQFELCTSLRIPGSELTAKVSTAEYNIIAKLNWYLKSNRVLERQIRDVRSMLVINRDTLDEAYLKKWSRYFRTEDLLAEVRGDAV